MGVLLTNNFNTTADPILSTDTVIRVGSNPYHNSMSNSGENWIYLTLINPANSTNIEIVRAYQSTFIFPDKYDLTVVRKAEALYPGGVYTKTALNFPSGANVEMRVTAATLKTASMHARYPASVYGVVTSGQRNVDLYPGAVNIVDMDQSADSANVNIFRVSAKPDPVTPSEFAIDNEGLLLPDVRVITHTSGTRSVTTLLWRVQADDNATISDTFLTWATSAPTATQLGDGAEITLIHTGFGTDAGGDSFPTFNAFWRALQG